MECLKAEWIKQTEKEGQTPEQPKLQFLLKAGVSWGALISQTGFSLPMFLFCVHQSLESEQGQLTPWDGTWNAVTAHT